MENHCKLDVFSKLQNYQDWAPFILRLFFGFFLMMHGIGKLWGPAVGLGPGMEAWIGMLGMMGMPAFFAYLVAWIEFLGGIFLIIGLLTRWISVFGGIIMLVAFFAVHLKNGFLTGELSLIYLGAFMALLFLGAGKWGIDTCANCHRCNKKGKKKK